MLFALPLLAAFILGGFASGMPLAGTLNTSLASRADYQGTVNHNSTNLAARFVHSSTPPVCSKANIFCMTKTGKNALVLGSYHTFGRPQIFRIFHDDGNWATVGFTEGVAGSVDYQCNNKANTENHVKVTWGFSVGGTSYVSLSTDVALAASSDGKFLAGRGTIDSDTIFVDFQAWCRDF